jgi:predicted nuclease of predicted toxin-antitoxin system
VKLLFDANLSQYLVERLSDLFPGSSHVQIHDLQRAIDPVIWDYAKREGFAIVTKDEDFNQLAVIRGFPPKILWLQLGNCTTADVEAAIRSEHFALQQFNADPDVGTFVLRRTTAE